MIGHPGSMRERNAAEELALSVSCDGPTPLGGTASQVDGSERVGVTLIPSAIACSCAWLTSLTCSGSTVTRSVLSSAKTLVIVCAPVAARLRCCSICVCTADLRVTVR